MQKYVYDSIALEILRKNKKNLEITDDLALKILLELYPGTYEWKTKDLTMVSADEVYTLQCINETQKLQLCNLIEELGIYLMPSWDWTAPSKAHQTSTPDLRGLLSRLLAVSQQ
jgi:hypothetical protein